LVLRLPQCLLHHLDYHRSWPDSFGGKADAAFHSDLQEVAGLEPVQRVPPPNT
jgi:hypothetical protein